VPMHLRNALHPKMAELGYSKGYQYPHDYKGNFTTDEYLPKELQGSVWYHPIEAGYEKTIGERLAYWRDLRKQAKEGK